MKKEIKRLNERIAQLEKAEKKKSVIITGLKIDRDDDKIIKEMMDHFITRKLQVSAKLRNARKIRKKTV